MYKLLVDGRNDYDLSFSAIYEKEFHCYDDDLRVSCTYPSVSLMLLVISAAIHGV